MFIKEIKDKTISVSIPLVNGSGKTRIKTRPILNDYGLPFSTRSENFNANCYVEWQIGYDVMINDFEKSKLSTMKDLIFVGANGKTKALYELSEYIKLFYDWDIITSIQLDDIFKFLSNLKNTDYLDQNPNLKILRQDTELKIINGTEFLFTKVEYPILIYQFKQSETVVEIIIKERQYARGTQPMLYLCFPIAELDNGIELIGRNANKNEFASFTISENNISIFLELIKIFGTLSASHNHDIREIIKVIL